MRILYHHRTASRDGQAVHIGELTSALRERGHEIVMVGPPSGTAGDRLGGGGGVVAALRRASPVASELLELAYSLVAYRRLHAAWRRDRPAVLYERYNLFLPAGVWLRERTGIPMLLEVNSPLAAERLEMGNLRLRRLAEWSERRAWRGADLVLPVTGVLGQAVHDAGVPHQRIRVIPNGTDPRRFAALPSRDEAKARLALSGRLVLGFAGFVRPWHGLDQVVEWLAGAPPSATLLVIGDGPAREPLLAQARRLGLEERVRVTGVVQRDALPSHLAACDVALQPAVTPYASPLKLFEYMACGLAIAAPDQPNVREVLRDDEDALLFPPGGGAGLRRALDRLVAEPTLRQRLGNAARATVARGGYTWAQNAARVEEAAGSLLSVPEASSLPSDTIVTSGRRAHSRAR